MITRDEIERTGAQNVAELLQYVSANASGGQILVTNVIGAQTNSVSTAALRGLGGQNTLVLLNGKRLTAASGEIQGVYGVNLDSIPFSAIERVEVLKDGASAVYGSDAIGGVINFILRQDFRGAEVTLYYGAPTRSGGGGEKYNATGTVGFGDLAKDKYNVFVSRVLPEGRVARPEQAQLLRQQRRSRPRPARRVGQHVPGAHHDRRHRHAELPELRAGIFDPGPRRALLLRSGGRRRRQLDSRAGNVQPVRVGPLAVQPELAGSTARSRTRRSTRATSSSRRRCPTRSPTARTPSSLRRSCCQPSSPYYPTALAKAAGVGGQPLNLRYRAYALGLRDTTDENEAWQGVAGIKGTAWNWDFDFDFVYSKNETQLGAQRRLRALFADPAAAQQRPRESVRSDSTPEVQAEIDALQFREETFERQVDRLPVRGQGDRRPVQAAGGQPGGGGRASRPASRSSSRTSTRRCRPAT